MELTVLCRVIEVNGRQRRTQTSSNAISALMNMLLMSGIATHNWIDRAHWTPLIKKPKLASPRRHDFAAGEIDLTVTVSPETVPVTVTFCPAYLSICLVSPFRVYGLPPLTRA